MPLRLYPAAHFFRTHEGPLRYTGATHICDSMIMPFDQSDYSVVIKRRAPPPTPWRWEIYRAGRASAIEQSSTFFPTMAAAGSAGKQALKRFLDKRHSEDLPVPLV